MVDDKAGDEYRRHAMKCPHCHPWEAEISCDVGWALWIAAETRRDRRPDPKEVE